MKVTPFKVNKNGSISAKERLVLTIILITWKRIWMISTPPICGKKCQKMLLLFFIMA
ncbi:MAG: MutH/Sau3AI family endonuclease [Streptococcus sp.]